MTVTADVSCTAEEFKCKTDGVCIQDRYVAIRSFYFDKNDDGFTISGGFVMALQTARMEVMR